MISISSIELGQLQTTLYYGTGAFILFILSMYAIIIYQVYNMSTSQGNIPVYSSLFKIFYFYVGLSLMVMIFFAILIVLNHTKTANPAVGIYSFFNLRWEDFGHALAQIKSSPAYTQSPTAQKETVLWLTVMIGGVKSFYVILITGSIFFVPLLGVYYPYKECKRRYEGGENDMGCFAGAVMTSTLYTVVVYSLLLLAQGEITYLLSMAKDNNYAVGIGDKVNFLDDIKYYFKAVRHYAEQMVSDYTSGTMSKTPLLEKVLP